MAKKRVDDEGGFDARNVVDNDGRFSVELPQREAKSEAKRRALQLEALGEELVALKPGLLEKLALPEDVRDAVVECQRLRDKRALGGHRRQVQRLGVIMRGVDAAPIAAALAALREEGTQQSPAIRDAERWRTRLLDEGDAAITALCAERPQADRTSLRQLVRAAAEERTRQAAKPDTSGQAQRRLFKLVRSILEDTPADGSDG